MPSPFRKLLLPRAVVRSEYPPITAIKFLVPWLRFICQRDIEAYWDATEQIGLVTRIHLFRGGVISILQGYSHVLRASGLTSQWRRGSRFSLMQNNRFLAGPASLANHACSKCSNCALDFKSLSFVVNNEHIARGERLYITYSHEQDMRNNRQIFCLKCRLYFTGCLHYFM